MTDQWMARLSEYLDGELPADERAALEVHLSACAACREVLEELRGVVARVATLEDCGPPRDLWAGVARSIGSEGAARRPRRLSFSVPQLLAASVALMLLAGGTAWLTATRRATEQGGGWWATDASYDAAIAELQGALESGRRSGRLDSTTIRVVGRNLAIIDSAIIQARRALTTDPGSAYLNHHLADTMRRKLELLRQATTIAGART